MRYLGLVFLGMILCRGQTAGAVQMTAAESMEVVTNGKVISEHTRLSRKWNETIRTTRIIWKSRLCICEDQVVFHEKITADQVNGQVVATCFDDEKASN